MANQVTLGIVVMAIAYLLGAIPSAYIVTRLLTGKDIRELGGGNVGARNAFTQVGRAAGVLVFLMDAGKGIGAVGIAYRAFNVPLYYFAAPFTVSRALVLAAGIVAVCGHIWPVYLRFRGGKGLATSLGVLSFVLWRELVIVFLCALLLLWITRNSVFSMHTGLLTAPISVAIIERAWLPSLATAILLLIMLLHYLPDIRGEVQQGSGVWGALKAQVRTKKPGARAP